MPTQSVQIKKERLKKMNRRDLTSSGLLDLALGKFISKKGLIIGGVTTQVPCKTLIKESNKVWMYS